MNYFVKRFNLRAGIESKFIKTTWKWPHLTLLPTNSHWTISTFKVWLISLHVCIDRLYFESFLKNLVPGNSEPSRCFFLKTILQKDAKQRHMGGGGSVNRVYNTGQTHNNTIYFRGNGLIWRQRQKKEINHTHHTNIDQKEHSHLATHLWEEEKKQQKTSNWEI